MEARGDDTVLDALILAVMVDAHVTNRTKAKLCDLRELVLESFTDLRFTNKSVELLDRVTT